MKKSSKLKFSMFSFTYLYYMYMVRLHLHFHFSCRVYVGNLKESVVRILQGTESSVLERADTPRSLSSDYGRPDKQAAVNTLKSRFRK